MDALTYMTDRARNADCGKQAYIRRSDRPGILHAVQTHSGTTRYALRAYLALRDHLRVPGVEVWGGSGGDTSTHEVGTRVPGVALLTLDGVAWGYGGEGPNGLAAILADLGFFDGDKGAALRWVAAQDQARGWQIDLGSGA